MDSIRTINQSRCEDQVIPTSSNLTLAGNTPLSVNWLEKQVNNLNSWIVIKAPSLIDCHGQQLSHVNFVTPLPLKKMLARKGNNLKSLQYPLQAIEMTIISYSLSHAKHSLPINGH